VRIAIGCQERCSDHPNARRGPEALDGRAPLPIAIPYEQSASPIQTPKHRNSGSFDMLYFLGCLAITRSFILS
jgi:hypothetical protein